MYRQAARALRSASLSRLIDLTHFHPSKIAGMGRPRHLGQVLALLVGAGLVTALVALHPLERAQAQTAAGTWRHHTCGDCITGLALSEDAIWAGTHSAGLIRHDRATGAVRQFTVEDGLPGRSITDLDIAPDGGLWIATFDSGLIGKPSGLAYWDGSSWHHRGLIEAVVRSAGIQVVALNGGRAMARFEGGVAYYDGQAWIRQGSDQGLDPADVRHIARASGGSAYVTTSAGVVRHDGRIWLAEDTSSLPSTDLRWIDFGPGDALWVEGPDFLARSDKPDAAGGPRNWSLHPLPPNPSGDPVLNPTILAGIDRSDRPWAMGEVTYSYDGQAWTSRDLLAEMGMPDGVIGLRGSLRSSPPIAFAEDDQLWVGQVPTGLWHFDGGSWSQRPSRIGPSNLIGFSVKVAPDGQVWLGHMPLLHPDRLLDRYDGQSWTHVGQAEGLPTGGTLGVTQSNLDVDRGGRVWLASDGDDLLPPWIAWQSGPGWDHVDLTDLRVGQVRCVTADDRGGVWLGNSSGVTHYDPSSGDILRLTTEQGLPSNEVLAITVDHRLDEDRVWIGTRAGAALLAGGRLTRYTSADGLGLDAVGAIVVDEQRDAVWFATPPGSPSVVSRLDAGGWTRYDQGHGLAGEGFWSLELGPDGSLWGAISDDSEEHSGLARFDGAGWTILREEDGLLSNAAFDIAVDAQGRVWVATISGLSELAPFDHVTLTPSPPPVPFPTASPSPPSPTPESGCVCRSTRDRAPASLVTSILADPDRLGGHGQPRDANKPPSPYNPPRLCLGIHDGGRNYHPLFNPLAWKAGCP